MEMDYDEFPSIPERPADVTFTPSGYPELAKYELWIDEGLARWTNPISNDILNNLTFFIKVDLDNLQIEFKNYSSACWKIWQSNEYKDSLAMYVTERAIFNGI